MKNILCTNILAAIKDIKDNGKNIDEETIMFINKLFFSYNHKISNFDVVLILGGLQERRAIVGSHLVLKEEVPVIFSGGVFHECFNATEAEYYQKIAIEQGVDCKKIYLENDSTNTYENFLYSLGLIKKLINKDVIDIAVVTNSIHLPRAILIADEIIKKNNYNMKLTPYPSDGIKNNKENWMNHVETRKSVVSELTKILKYHYYYKNDLAIRYTHLDNTMKDLLLEQVFPGATYAIVNKNYCMMGVCGNKSLYPLEENYLNTLYDMASLTKVVITNTILLRMLQSGKIKLSDKMGLYLEDYAYLDITIYHLVTHSAGLKPSLDNRNIKSHDDFKKTLRNIKLDYTPGTKSIYSDIGFILLGMVIETVYNMNLDKIAEIEIFKPLSMKRATFYPNSEDAAPTEKTSGRGMVRGKVHDESAYYSNKILGHAGLFCDINDVSKFVKMILNDGKISNKVYLDKKYIDMLFHTEVIDIDGVSRSIGWVLGKTNSTGDKVSKNTISHTGFTGTSIVIDRTKKIGIIVLSNRVHPTRENKLLVSKRKEIINSLYQDININFK